MLIQPYKPTLGMLYIMNHNDIFFVKSISRNFLKIYIPGSVVRIFLESDCYKNDDLTTLLYLQMCIFILFKKVCCVCLNK